MGTTIPTKFEGTPILTPLKIDTITQWYHGALGDADKAGDMDDAYYYEGLVSGLESTLTLLYEVAEEAAEAVKTGHSNLKTAVIITGTVGLVYLYLKNDKKIKAAVSVRLGILLPQSNQQVQSETSSEDKPTNSTE